MADDDEAGAHDAKSDATHPSAADTMATRPARGPTVIRASLPKRRRAVVTP